MDKVQALLKSKVFWILAAVVVAYAVLSGRKRGAAGGAIPHEEPDMIRTGAGALQGVQSEQVSAYDKLLETLQLKELSRSEELSAARHKTELMSEEIESSRLDFIAGFADYLRRGGSKGKTTKEERKKYGRVKCPKGNPRIDAETGEVFCREKQHKGFFQGLSANDLLDAAKLYYGPSAGKRSTTHGSVGRTRRGPYGVPG
jgi:hypothetical protein